MKDEEIVKEIDRYLNGKLTEKEIDLLWSEFLKNPEYFELLKTEVIAREYFLHKKIEKEETRPSKSPETDERRIALIDTKALGYGIAAFFVIILLFWFVVVDHKSAIHSELVAAISPHEMVTTNLYRSVDGAQKQLDIMISRGFEAAISGRIDQSIEYFSTVLESNPMPDQKAVANLNYGILLYNNEDFEAASKAFETVGDTDDLSSYTTEKGLWYLANSLAHLENFEDALDAALQAYALDGLFKEAAGRLVEILEEKNSAKS